MIRTLPIEVVEQKNYVGIHSHLRPRARSRGVVLARAFPAELILARRLRAGHVLHKTNEDKICLSPLE
jgi:hypothetical protein